MNKHARRFLTPQKVTKCAVNAVLSAPFFFLEIRGQTCQSFHNVAKLKADGAYYMMLK